MSRKGGCWDNACAESIFRRLKAELIGRYICQTEAEAQDAVFEYPAKFYSRERRHSSLDYPTSTKCEQTLEARLAS